MLSMGFAESEITGDDTASTCWSDGGSRGELGGVVEEVRCAWEGCKQDSRCESSDAAGRVAPIPAASAGCTLCGRFGWLPPSTSGSSPAAVVVPPLNDSGCG